MTAVDHRFIPRPGFDRCVKCDEPRDHAGHFGDHVKPIAPVPGFACAQPPAAPKLRKKREAPLPEGNVMRERPILFSGAMIRAILAGAKSQTRRLVRAGLAVTDVCGGGVDPVIWWPRDALNRDAGCPYGVPGDRLWVKETWRADRAWDWVRPKAIPRRSAVWYEAGGDRDVLPDSADVRSTRGRPSIFMPRWASRITLEVTEVRVQRLQDISEEDARAEGYPGDVMSPRDWYECLWTAINGAGSWVSNPWVWAISFQRKETP